MNESDCLSLQLTISSIWGAGSAAPKLSIVPEFSSDGVHFAGLASAPSIDDVTAVGTSIDSGSACGGVVRLRATFELDNTGTTGPGAVTFSSWISRGDDGV